MTRTPMPMPRSVGTIGMWLFLAALFMLFSSSMLGYVFIRVAGPGTLSQQQQQQPLHLPSLLWVSTVMVLGVSLAMHNAVGALRLERHGRFRLWLGTAMALAVGFVLVQTPAMAAMLREHQSVRTSGLHIYGLVFTLVLLHALHVVGGIVSLSLVWAGARRGRYDHEHYLPVRHATMYWHFLDLIWIFMFATFLLVG